MQTINLKQLKLQPEDKVLDLGCGEGRHALGLSLTHAKTTVLAVDISLKDLGTAQSRLHDFSDQKNHQSLCAFVCGDGLQLPFKSHSFDHIICSEVLEHIPDYHTMLNEIKRILKPQGTLAISIPRAWPEKICWKLSSSYHQVEGGHIRIFSAKHLKQEVQEKGFLLFKRHWAHALHSPYWWMKCLFWDKPDHYWPIKLYHSFLVWDLLKKPFITQQLEKCLNPLMGKSVVMYFTKTVEKHFDNT